MTPQKEHINNSMLSYTRTSQNENYLLQYLIATGLFIKPINNRWACDIVSSLKKVEPQDKEELNA